jgi:RNA 2',3'-cyclic 3'-phosphodiesterase
VKPDKRARQRYEMVMLRLFIALPLPTPLITAIAPIQAAPFAARWQTAAQLHLSLGFVGEVAEPDADALAEALAGVSAPPISLALAGVGHFANKGRVHSLWAGVTPTTSVTDLAERVAHAARRAGTPVEARRFVPHITVARLSVSETVIAPWLAAHGALKSEPALISRFHLYESTLGSSGASYTELADYRLG